MRKKAVSRREALAWIALLTSGTGLGLCGVGGFIGLLALRRAAMQKATPIPPPSVTPSIKPRIVSRAEWGAREPNHEATEEFGFASAENPEGWYVYPGDLAAIYHTVVIHHSYPVKMGGTVQELQNIHMDGRHWADIGYHFAVAADGTIYEGREINVRGAHVAKHNTGTIGVVGIGDFQTEQPSEVQLQAIQALVNWLKEIYTLTHLAGHGEFNPETVCPGPMLRFYLDFFARNAGLLRGTGGQ